MRKNIFTCVAAMLAAGFTVNGQQTGGGLLGQNQTITSTVPFLMIAPDSRSGAMGDAGVAISPDANLMHWNPAKLAFVPTDFALSVSYTPWLRALVPDISLSYIGGYKRIDELSGFGGSLRYFSLGDIAFTDNSGN
ncbi:MAG: PorV/PorQ family protein, partial [Bacteroidota bacterium]|nr:PorV/PorQ family protein [Bacteroidota bacterium]